LSLKSLAHIETLKGFSQAWSRVEAVGCITQHCHMIAWLYYSALPHDWLVVLISTATWLVGCI